ncbi:hypothetical protein O6P43_013900 [Quillaja saponaria]|uniref:Uncharacterized protein n=1 Tax=Quillaja saponaria TaxID=32244 RepID=A0AAD7LTI0_QUISA|nr:hypothetical protein O6P43_013900 [Quillaja saponaria]
MRTRKTQKELQDDEYYSSMNIAQPEKKYPPENVMLLSRNIDNQSVSGFMSPILDRVEYWKRVIDLQIERERDLMNMGGNNLGWEGKTKAV